MMKWAVTVVHAKVPYIVFQAHKQTYPIQELKFMKECSRPRL